MLQTDPLPQRFGYVLRSRVSTMLIKWVITGGICEQEEAADLLTLHIILRSLKQLFS